MSMYCLQVAIKYNNDDDDGAGGGGGGGGGGYVSLPMSLNFGKMNIDLVSFCSTSLRVLISNDSLPFLQPILFTPKSVPNSLIINLHIACRT